MRKKITLIIILFIFINSFIAVAQRGKDGNVVVTTPNTIINEFTSLTADANAGAVGISVVNSALNTNGRFPSPLATGDLIMIIQMQGASIKGNINDNTWGEVTNYNNCGHYEFMEVLSILSPTSIRFTCGLVNSYTATGKVQVVRVPRYSSLTINTGASIITPTWDGTIGGIVTAEILGNTTVNGKIDVSGLGFRGGTMENNTSGPVASLLYSSFSSFDGAEKGEGIAGYQVDYDVYGGRFSIGAPANAGGGGNAHNAGGGGGANAGNIAIWNGNGIPDISNPSWINAWNLEAPGFSNNISSGGGRGGYTFSENDADGLISGAGDPAWGGDFRQNFGGKGGRPLDYTGGRIFFGGGGGAGDANNLRGTPGASGGGIVYLMSYGQISGTDSILANGNNGTTIGVATFESADAPGGGGGGGTIVLNSVGNISGVIVNANGGAGGIQQISWSPEAEGPGGGGGGGYIFVSNGTATLQQSGGACGTTNSPGVTEFIPNGATKGAIGLTGVVTYYTFTPINARVCSGLSATLTLQTSGTLPFGTSFTWYDAATGGNVLGTGNSFTTPPLTATTIYYVGPCPGTYRLPDTAFVNPVPVIITNNAAICSGQSAVLNASGATSYTWSPASTLSTTTGTSVTANPTITTTYTIVGTYTTGCTGSTTAVVTIDPNPLITIPPITICDGGSGTLTASGANTYTWSPATNLSAATGASVTANPPATTTYTVTGTSTFGCTGNTTVVVTVNPPIVLSTSGIDVTCFGACNGQTIVIPSGGAAPYTYSWSSGCSAAACNSICAGIYSVLTTDAIGCTASAIATVTEPTPLVITNLGQTNVSCFGLCDGTASVSASGATPPYIYSWVPTGGNAATASGLCAGTFTCTVTDANNCTVKTSVTITQPTPVVVISNNVTICPNASTTLSANASGGIGTITYSWNPGAFTSSSISVSPAVTSTYTITATDSRGCTGKTSVVVTAQPTPVIAVPVATICFGLSTTLNATGANTYSWSPSTSLSSSTGASVKANPSTTTTYTVIGTSTVGCTGVTTVVVTVNPLPIVTATNGNACPDFPITLTTQGAITYTWLPASGLNKTTGNIVIATPSASTTYTITGTSINGCTATAISVAIVNPKPVANFTTSPDVINILNPTVYFTDHSTGGIINSWNWSLGDVPNSFSSSKNPSYTYPNEIGTYTIQLIVTNQFGCMDTTTDVISVIGVYTFFIPNTFTPNGDGKNDYFFAKGVGIDETDYDLWIFDRWGNLIWHTSIWGEQWDGRANNGENIAQIDTYVWKVHVKEKETGIKHNYIGHVNIVK